MLLPVVTLCVGAETAVPVLTIAQLLGNLSRMAFGIRQIDWKSVGLFCATALPLAALGAFGFSVLPKDIITRCIGGVLITLVLIKAFWKLNLKRTQKYCLSGGRSQAYCPGSPEAGGPLVLLYFFHWGYLPLPI